MLIEILGIIFVLIIAMVISISYTGEISMNVFMISIALGLTILIWKQSLGSVGLIIVVSIFIMVIFRNQSAGGIE